MISKKLIERKDDCLRNLGEVLVILGRKFNPSFAFINIQISIIFDYILINHELYKIFIMWMSI